MSIFNIFHKKEEEKRPIAKKKAKEKSKPLTAEKDQVKKEPVKKEVKIEPIKAKKKHPFAFDVLLSPHITEKAALAEEQNKYIFKVFPEATKPEIRKSVEGIYGVDVLGIGIVNIPSKKRRTGRGMGAKAGYKKAIVQIKEGQKIEIMPR